MKLAITVSDLSNNCLGRAYVLLKVMPLGLETSIVGPLNNNQIWKPLEKENLNLDYVSSDKFSDLRIFIALVKKLFKYDTIYASKPLPFSFGAAIIAKILKPKIRLLIDVDDWQLGFLVESFCGMRTLGKLKYLFLSLVNPFQNYSIFSVALLGLLVKCVKSRSVSNNFLRLRFGGIVLPHFRDTDVLNPQIYNAQESRNSFGLHTSEKIIMFLGTPRLHKGLDVLIDALASIVEKDFLLVMVGINQNDKSTNWIIRSLNERLQNRSKVFPEKSFSMLGEILNFADILVVPQKESLSTRGQIPAKLFDAMAMAKPIIATNINDISEILYGCGYVVPPDNHIALANAIRNCLDDLASAKYIGIKAREKCEKYYSYKVGIKIVSHWLASEGIISEQQMNK